MAAQAVTIGRDCKIARDVIIMDTDQHELPGAELLIGPVEIQDRVWKAMGQEGLPGPHSAVRPAEQQTDAGPDRAAPDTPDAAG